MNERIATIPIGYLELPEHTRKQILTDLLSLGSLSFPSPEFINDSVNYPHDEGCRISIYFRASMYQINFFSTEDPSQLHYSIAREVLSKIGGEELESDEKARDLLARELVKECKSFAAKIIPSALLQENNKDRSLFIITKKDEEAQHLICEINGNFWQDDLFFKHLKKLGKSGRKRAEELSKSSKKWMEKFHEDGKLSGLFRMWVAPTVPLYYCRFPRVLAEILWEDRVRQLIEREKKNVTALTQGVFPSIVKILSSKAETKKIEGRLQIVHDGKVIATIPMIDPGLLRIVTKGAESLNSYYHHLLIRYECRAGFENWMFRSADARVLLHEGGYSEIAKKLGLSSCRAVEEIKNLLHAQAHMDFRFGDGSSGNLIVLSKFPSRRCGRDDGVGITLGDRLLPYFTFQESGRGKLLIPVPQAPPLISSTNSHAGQMSLQMLVVETFAAKSTELAEIGSVEITQEMWARLAKEAGLTQSIFLRTLDRWVNDGDDGPRFLESKGDDRYSFGPAYQKEESFLKEQGTLRKRNQVRGKRSVEKKKRKRS